jgi:two-component system response regulator FixJ
MADHALRIDIVDDEESVRKALGRLLQVAGFEVRTFSSGEDFLRRTMECRPDCIVLDISMPQPDGFAILQTLRQAGSTMPVLVITGDDSPTYRSRALQHGACAFLLKPVDESVLLDAIERALEGSGGRSA